MINLNFSSIKGQSIIYSKYTFSKQEERLYITPAKNSIARQIDPLENIDALIMDIISVAQAIVSCNNYMYFLSKGTETSIIYENFFWKQEDYFLVNDTDETKLILNILQSFAEKYGLPEWVLEKDSKAILPPEYTINSHSIQNEEPSAEYLNTFLQAKTSLHDNIIYPVCSFTLFFLDFFNIFTINRTSKLTRVDCCWLYFRNEPDQYPELAACAIGLKPSIILAFIAFSTGYQKQVHKCKQCGKYFITTDTRTEYCSPKCRTSYNTAQTRKRLKRQNIDM